MGSSDNEVIVAAAALVVSLIALAATFMQVLQQYVASASGYTQCDQKVIGRWTEARSRRFSWKELRFEVQFAAPVIFVCPPTNTNRPVQDAEMFVLDGTPKSLEESWTSLDMNTRDEYAKKTTKEKIHTADNERASWTIMLSAIQCMESDSLEWQRGQYKQRRSRPPNGLNPTSSNATLGPPDSVDSHTLAVALQRKIKSWDTMPTSITKPYATTTICHLVEILGALGVYWKEFDRRLNRYRAEGNGLMVIGEKNSDLGLLFTFQVYGKCHFEENRVIPNDSIKSFCFGYVPTIYQSTNDGRRLQSPVDDIQNISSLQMASRSEIAETLIILGCNNNTVNYFRDENSRTSHLFPISFELIGMLSETVHIDHTYFTYVPNPTPDCWDKRKVSLFRLLEAFRSELVGDEDPLAQLHRPVARMVYKHMKTIMDKQLDGTTEGGRLNFLTALHAAITDADEILTAKSKSISGIMSPAPNDGRTGYIAGGEGANLHSENEMQTQRRELVQDVLRSHIQELLRLLNDRDGRKDGHSLQVPPAEWDYNRERDSSRTPVSPTRREYYLPRFEDMDAVGPEERPKKFMEVYFHVIRPRVVTRATTSTSRRASIASARSLRYRTGMREASPAPSSPPEQNEEPPSHILAEWTVTHDDVWCTLVFRMICWLMLHDFNKHDLQISKSELYGNRMPVYIL